MVLTETIKLYPTQEQKLLIESTLSEYIRAVNATVSLAVTGTDITKFSSKHIEANLPSAVRGQVARDARSIVKKHYRTCHDTVKKNRLLLKRGKTIFLTAPNLPVIKKPCCYWNNQNFNIEDGVISLPVAIDGKPHRIRICTKMTDRQMQLLEGAKLGTLRIVKKNHDFVAQVTYEVAEVSLTDGQIMGIDLGIKCPAVSYTQDGKVRFYGNGRQNKYMRRHYKYLRRRLQSSKHPEAVKRINNKEQRVMRDIDHKISASIIKTAVASNVKIIRMEQLSNIRSTTRTSRKNNHSLHAWSFYRLMQFIEYKAHLAGIIVEYVNPAYTSQRCPHCGDIHHANDRHYKCKCGFSVHRDVLGAMNICNSTEVAGNRLPA